MLSDQNHSVIYFIIVMEADTQCAERSNFLKKTEFKFNQLATAGGKIKVFSMILFHPAF